MKKTCNGCRALEFLSPCRCVLGYSFDKNLRPLEECPKPKTYREYIFCHDNQIKAESKISSSHKETPNE